MDEAGARGLLRDFQRLYSERDAKNEDALRRMLAEGHELVGTGGVKPGDGDWAVGTDESVALILEDWRSWGDLTLDVDGAGVVLLGGAALVSCVGVLKGIKSQTEVVESEIAYQTRTLAASERSADALVRSSTEMLTLASELKKNPGWSWKIRFNAVLVAEGGAWKFRRMIFSFPTQGLPSVPE